MRTIFISVTLILIIGGILLYNNFNQLLSAALLNSFNASVASDVYELKYENLRVNLFEGSIRVVNVSIRPREKPLHDYPYINSSFRLKTETLMLENVEIFTLLKLNKLNLKRILISKPEVELILTGANPILLPFQDSTTVVSADTVKNKKSLGSFMLNEFQLIDASFHVNNGGKQREFKIKNFNISLYDLMVDKRPGEYLTSFKRVAVSVGELSGHLQKGPFRHVG